MSGMRVRRDKATLFSGASPTCNEQTSKM